MKIQFKTYSVEVDDKDVELISNILDEHFDVKDFSLDDWNKLDLLWRKHIVIYDKSRTKKPDIQPWCKKTVLKSLFSGQFGD